MVSEPNSADTAAHLNHVLELLRKLMDYRRDEVRPRLEKVGRAASMLHMGVLLVIYYVARSGGKHSRDWALPWRIHNCSGVWRA